MRITALLFTAAIIFAFTAPAHAYSWSTQFNCANDYYAYCAMHTAGSPQCHACMRANRAKLANACVVALIDDGILPKSETARQVAKLYAPKRAPMQSVVPNPEKRLVTRARAAKIAALKHAPRRPKALVAVAVSPPELAIDQQTFEAFKNREPRFVTEYDSTASNAVPVPAPQ